MAIKLVLAGLGSESAAQRLRREGLILRRVTSRHVARVYDSGDDDAGVWLVTELVEGAPLTIATLGRPLLAHEVLRVARGLLEGLSAVHDVGIVHGDVKPSNILVPRGDKALDGAKLVDFGLARIVLRSEVAASIGNAMTREGTVLGTARYMAPEVLSGGEPTLRSDLYAAGLVLFELLDVGPLFDVGDAREQLRARVSMEPRLVDRVPPPLSDVLSRMLSRDPSLRYRDAREAYEAVVDLDTAPVFVVGRESVAPPASGGQRTGRPSSIPTRRSTSPDPPPASSRPRPLSTSLPPPPSTNVFVGTITRSSLPPLGLGPESDLPPSWRRLSSPPIARLTSLPGDGVVALRETLRHLDLPMLDALARRERGNAIGRIARAVALALRLELDAAALILEPLAMQSDVARAIGVAILAPRARRATRARVDAEREDRWVESIDLELGAMLVALATALAAADDATRDADRCARALARLDGQDATALEGTRSIVRVAQIAARARNGELERAVALDLLTSLPSSETARAESPFNVVVRALCAAVLLDEAHAGRELERAERIAAETGTTLLDACTATALGTLIATTAPRDTRALSALERAGTLLAHGDAPSLENEAEQHRATVLVALGQWPDAIVHLRAARDAAHSERAGELELRAIALQTIVELAVGEIQAAYQSAAMFGESRLAAVSGRAAALGWVARALSSWVASDHEGAEDALTAAESRLREVDRKHADLYVLVEILGVLFDAARGALPDLAGSMAALERFAEVHGFGAFYWFGLLTAITARLPDADVSRKVTLALDQLATVLGPGSRLARVRHSVAPPHPA